jgi:hypothetical protein
MRPPGAAGETDGQLRITYLTAPACRLCEHGRGLLDGMADRFAFVVREVDMLSDEGRQLVARSRIPFPPAVLLEGRLVAHGRLSRRRLERELEHIARTRAATTRG